MDTPYLCVTVDIDHIKARPYHPAVQPVISAEQMRNIDRLTIQQSEISSLQLMQNAARACFQEISNCFSGKLSGKKVLILCGPGNNGGDGATLAQEMARVGVVTRVVLFGRVEDSKGDARTNFEIVRRLANPGDTCPSSLSFVEINTTDEWNALSAADNSWNIIVDALFGTGLTRPLEGVFASVVEHLRGIRSENLNSLNRPLIVSIDLPSGLNADLPTAIGPAVESDLTVTFTAPKAANVLTPAAHLNGQLVIANIGSPASLIESADSGLFCIEKDDITKWLIKTRYKADSFKNTHGHVLVIAGSTGYTGAAVLCGNAAMRSGAGLVTIATAASAQPSIAATVMSEVMTTPLAETDRGAISDEAIAHVNSLAAKATVIAIGPGLSSDDERTRRFVYAVVKDRRTPMVIDADALNCLAPWPVDLRGTSDAPLILTPHPGEMLRLLGTEDKSVLEDRVSMAREFATKHNVILVLKGSRALVAIPGRVFINPTGNAGLGTAGSGDTLTGIIAGFVAQSLTTMDQTATVIEATIAALYLGGLAGDFAAAKYGMRSMVASDIREHLGEAICSLDPEGERPVTLHRRSLT